MMKRRTGIFGLICLFVLMMASPIYAETTGGRVRIGGDLNVPADHVVEGDTVTVFGSQVIEGNVKGSVVAVFGDIELSGAISDDVVTVFGDVILKEGAQVEGDMVNILGNIERQGTIQIGGDEVTMNAGEIGRRISDHIRLENLRFHWLLFPFQWPFWGLFWALIWTAAMMAIFPKQVKNMAMAIENDVIQVGLKGLLGVVGIVVAAVLLSITIIGIPVAALLGVLSWIAMAFGTVAIYYLVGERLAEQFHWEFSEIARALTGALLIGLIVMLPLGSIVQLFMGLWGLGGVLITKFGSHQPWIE